MVAIVANNSTINFRRGPKYAPELAPCHTQISISPWICSANQWTGFYMIGTSVCFWHPIVFRNISDQFGYQKHFRFSTSINTEKTKLIVRRFSIAPVFSTWTKYFAKRGLNCSRHFSFGRSFKESFEWLLLIKLNFHSHGKNNGTGITCIIGLKCCFT